MKPVRRTTPWALAALTAALAAAPALADDDCDVPTQRWQSREAVMQMAARKGWQVQRLKIDDGCYEIRGKDAAGRSFKAKIDPETLAPVKIKYRDGSDDQDRDRARAREREHPPPQDAAPGSSAQPQSSSPAGDAASGTPPPLFTPGTKPRAQID
ncbi:MAG TPA: PepSY domain-containing protein [Rubrivivax sp.]|nr:PepSY domain-containing protein [Rubrivivax sp.]